MKKGSLLCTVALLAGLAGAAPWPGFERGMGIGGWLTNYKRFNVLPENKRLDLTKGDFAHFDTYITEGDVARIARWGFDHIRLGFDQIVLEDANGAYRERTFSRIDAFLAWCAKYRLGVVLNLHKAIGNYCDIPEKVQLLDTPALQDRFVRLWLEFERRYAAYPNVAFELLNEVRDVDPEAWNRLADRTVRAIRERNPSRWIVIGSICWNSPERLAALRVWNDPRIVYTFHMYAPFGFTHQRGVLQAGPLHANEDVPYPGTAAVERALAPAVAWAKAHPDLILWNGEFGTIRHANPMSRASYMRDVIRVCRAAGIPYCVWNYLSTPNDGNRFSLVDDDTRDFLTVPLREACLGRDDWTTGTLTFATMNIWGDYFGNPVWERDLEQATFIRARGPDLVGMQEVTPHFWASRLFTTLAADYGVIRNPTNDLASYNPLLWRKDRLECLAGGTHVYALKDNYERSKGFGWGVFRDRATGKRFVAYSTHLMWTSPRYPREQSAQMRVNNAGELFAHLEALRTKFGPLPVVGGGDLNTTERDREKGEVTPLADWRAAGYADAQYAVKGASAYSSNHGDPKRNAQGDLTGFVSPKAADPKLSLDHVHYTTNDVTPVALTVDRSERALRFSDHSPVLFTFRLDGQTDGALKTK